MTSKPRGIQPSLRAAVDAASVVVLEGPRASGKTTLVTELAAAHRFVVIDLQDPDARARFSSDPMLALSQAGPLVVLDEAQLIDGLPLAVKRYVDEQDDRHVVLTGSAKITRDDLGGSDPLAGRAIRLTLRPLVQGERNGHPTNLTERLLAPSSDLLRGPLAEVNRSDLVGRIAIGGLPTVPGVVRGGLPSQRERVLKEYLESALVLAPQAEGRDRTQIQRAARYLLGCPARILNLSRAASDLGITRVTLDGYLQILEEAFLIQSLPALRPNARDEATAHPKLLPGDIGLGAWATDLPRRPRLGDAALGPLVEAFVLNELAVQGTWMLDPPQLLHWRDARRKLEVDGVLRSSNGSVVAIEIKSRSMITEADVVGVRALLDQAGTAALRGVIFYSGRDRIDLGGEVVALPISDLWSPPPNGETWSFPRRGEAPMLTGPSAPQAKVFVSYARSDDEADGGRIVQLARDLIARYKLATGDELDLFIDVDGLRLGDDWEERIQEEIAAATFFLPVITPSFLRSSVCRRETDHFLAKAERLGEREFVLPVLYIDVGESDDPQFLRLSSYEWSRWTDLRYEDPASGPYKREVDRMVQRLAMAAATAELSDPPQASPPSEHDDADLLELFGQVEESISSLPDGAQDLTIALEGVIAPISAAFAPGPGGPSTPGEMQHAIREAAIDIDEPVQDLVARTAELRTVIETIDRAVTAVLGTASSNPAVLETMGSVLDDLAQLPSSLDADSDELEQLDHMLLGLRSMARDLRPAIDSLRGALTTLTDLIAMADRWSAEASSLRS